MRAPKYDSKESVIDRLKEKFVNSEEVNPEALKKNGEGALYNAMRNRGFFEEIKDAYIQANIPLEVAYKKKQHMREGWPEEYLKKYWWELRNNCNEDVYHKFLQNNHKAFFTAIRVHVKKKYNVIVKPYKYFVEEILGVPYNYIQKTKANGESQKCKGIIESKDDLDEFLIFLVEKMEFIDFRLLHQDIGLVNKIYEYYDTYNNWLIEKSSYEKKVRWCTSIYYSELGEVFEEIVFDILQELGMKFQKNPTIGKIRPDFLLNGTTILESKLSVDAIKAFINGPKIHEYLIACGHLYLIYLIGSIDFKLPKGVYVLSIYDLINKLTDNRKNHYLGKLELIIDLYEDKQKRDFLIKMDFDITELYAEFQKKLNKY